MNSVFATMTEIGQFYGKNAKEIGSFLKDIGFRDPDGAPSYYARANGLVEERKLEDRPFVRYWSWDVAKTTEALERIGLRRVLQVA